MHHTKLLILMLLVLQCSETTTKTNNPITPQEKTTALINFVATKNEASVEATWWIEICYPPMIPFQIENCQDYMIGERYSAFHITLDFAKQNSALEYPTGEIKYCAVLTGSARNWKSITVSKGETRTVIVALTE